MLIVKSLVIFFIIFIFVACVVWLYLTIDHIGDFIKTKKKRNIDLWKGSDSDERLILLVIIIVIPILCVVWVVSDTREGYTSVLSFMMQFIGISLAILAAIIAFRNYRRKSGDKFSYVSGGNKREISILLLRNEKDKTTSIFAIDVVLVTGERIRLVNFLWPIINPLNLSAFQTKKIEFEKVHLYGGRNPKDFDFKKVLELICITPSGEYEADKFTIDSLRSEFVEKNEILLANRIRNIASGWESKDIDPVAEYWLHLHESESIEGESWHENHVLTGYVSGGVFILTNQSLRYLDNLDRDGLKKYCLIHIHEKKVYGEYNPNNKSMITPDGEFLINGFFWDSDWERYAESKRGDNHHYYLFIEEVEKIKIDNAHK